MRSRNGRRPEFERSESEGFALLATLWLVVAISAAVLALSLASRGRRLAAANRLERGELTAAARGGLVLARERLTWALGNDSTNGHGDPWRDPQRWVSDTLTIGRARIVITATELGAQLPLQATDEEGFQGFLEGIGADGDLADRLGQEAADWQDADDNVRGRGAEAPTYQRVGAAVRPRNAYFPAPREFCDLDRMPPELCAAALPYMTTLGTGLVDLNSAPAAVLRSLPGVSAPVADVILTRRAHGGEWGSVDEVIRALPATQQGAVTRALPELSRRVRFRAEEIHLIVIATLPGSPVEGRVEAVLTRAGDAAFLTWYRS